MRFALQNRKQVIEFIKKVHKNMKTLWTVYGEGNFLVKPLNTIKLIFKTIISSIPK